MARRSTPTKPERPLHTVEEKRRDIERLQRRINQLEAFDPQTVTKRFSDPSVTAIEKAIDETLSAVFGHGTVEYDRYSEATALDHGPVNVTPVWRDETIDARRYVAEGKQQAISLLSQAVRGLEEEIELAPPAPQPLPTSATRPKPSRKVFIVHGHDEGAREAVARFLTDIDFQPIILHEQASQNRTVKVEHHGDVGFAVVLLTPDDIGGPKDGEQRPRARQNVILELGYFIGRLGRERVCALKRGDLEIPSDFGGVVYETFDASGGWKQALGKELRAAGYEIDWNKVMR